MHAAEQLQVELPAREMVVPCVVPVGPGDAARGFEEEEGFAHDAAVGGDGAVEVAVEVYAARYASVVDHCGCGGRAAEGVTEDDGVLGVDGEWVLWGRGAQGVEHERDVLCADSDQLVYLCEDGVGAGIEVDIGAVHDAAVWELDDLGVVGVVDGGDDVAVARDFLNDGRVEEARDAAARREEEEWEV